MGQKFSNNARSRLVGSLSSSATSFTVESATADLFPIANTTDWLTVNDWFKAVLEDSSGNIEIVHVGSRNSGSGLLTNVLRGQEGTAARTFNAGATVSLRLTAADFETALAKFEDVTAFMLTLMDDADAAAARATLGATTVGGALFTAADEAAARATIGAVSLTGDQTIAGTKTFSSTISGNAATATTASNLSRSVNAAGLATGGGALTADRTITVTASSQAQAEAGTDTATAMTPLSTAQAIAKRAPAGYGRMWTDVTGSRTRGTAIQNVSTSDLWLSINGDGGSLNVQVSHNGTTWVAVADWSSGSGGYERYTATVLVPPGHYYKVSSGGSLNSWKELL